MNWYYAEAGQQVGPVDEAQLFELVRNGKIQADTLVWRDGMPAWARYAEAAPPGAPTPAAAAGAQTASSTGGGMPGGTSETVTCSECGRQFPPSEVIRYGDKWVCASCKPIFFQRVREGAALGMAGGAASATEADLLARDYDVDIGDYLSRAWELFKANAGILIGATVLVYMAMMAANMIPYLSVLLAIFLNGPLMGGLWAFYIKQVRNQQPTIGDGFSGFGPRFWQLVLTQLIPGLITAGFFAMMAALALPAIMVSVRHSGGGSSMAPALFVVLGVVALVAFIVLIYLNTCWVFALPLAADKGLKFWPALELSRRVVNKHWWLTFALLLVSGFLAIAGMLACLVGLLVTGPVAFAMITYHYEKVFGDLAPSPD